MTNYISDRAENRVFNLWLQYMELADGYIYRVYDRVGDLLDSGVQDFIDWALEEVPLLGTKDSYYDMESLWKEFIYTHRKDTKPVNDILQQTIDYDYFMKLMRDVICDCYNLDKLEHWMDQFKLTEAQRKYIIEIFEYDGAEMENTEFHTAREEIVDIGAYSDMLSKYKHKKDFIVIIPNNKDQIAIVFDEQSMKNFLK